MYRISNVLLEAEANSSSTSQEISRLLWNLKVHRCASKNLYFQKATIEPIKARMHCQLYLIINRKIAVRGEHRIYRY
jgi:hypothetical protein